MVTSRVQGLQFRIGRRYRVAGLESFDLVRAVVCDGAGAGEARSIYGFDAGSRGSGRTGTPHVDEGRAAAKVGTPAALCNGKNDAVVGQCIGVALMLLNCFFLRSGIDECYRLNATLCPRCRWKYGCFTVFPFRKFRFEGENVPELAFDSTAFVCYSFRKTQADLTAGHFSD